MLQHNHLLLDDPLKPRKFRCQVEIRPLVYI